MKKIAQLFIGCICFAAAMFASAQGTTDHIGQQKNVSLGIVQQVVGAPEASSDTGSVATDIELPLFNGETITLVQRKIETRGDNDFSWIGSVEGYPSSIAILVVKNGNITGQVNFADKQYDINPTPGDLHTLSEINLNALPTHEGDVISEEDPIGTMDFGAPSADVSEVLEIGTAAPGDEVEIDILAVYSIEAANNYSDVEQRIQLAIDYTNTAYELSGIPHTVRLAGAVPIDHNESGVNSEVYWMKDLFDGRLDYVHELREEYNADVISYWAYYIDRYCGQADAILSSAQTPVHILRVSCGGRTFAHELGHNQGARHNMEQDSSTTPFQYGHGSGSPTSQWRTIMSYTNACTNYCERISYFSTPSVVLNGEVLGDTEYRDNARVITETSPAMAEFSNVFNQEDVTSVTLLATDDSVSIDLDEIYPGFWIGHGTAEEGVTMNLQLSINGVLHGPQELDEYPSRFYRDRVVPSEDSTMNIVSYRTYPLIIKYDARYNYVDVTAEYPGHPSMYLRGTVNNWTTENPMTYIGNNVWTTQVDFQGVADERMKFDIHGDWTENFGASTINPEDGVQRDGGDIPVNVVGPHRVYVDFSVSRYWIVPATETTTNQPPVANAGADVTVEAGSVVQFDGSASYDVDGYLVSFEWSNGLTGEAPRRTYDEPGVYTVTLTVTDSGGLTATDTKVITVIEESTGFNSVFPSANLRGTSNGWASTPMTLIADYTWQVVEPFGAASNERFKFDIYGDWATNFGDTNGDGNLEQGGGDIAITEGEGNYRVTFNDQELTYSVEKIVGPTPPVANAGSDVSIRLGETVTFNGSATSSAPIVSYTWTSSAWEGELTGQTPSFTFNLVGGFVVTLTVEDENGLTDQDDLLVMVSENQAPTARIANGDVTVSLGDTVVFDGSTSSDSDGDVASYLWDNGDATSTSTRTFDSLGEFTVTLEVTDNEGATSEQASVTVTVVEAPAGVDVTFTCFNGNTSPGTSVYVVGNIPELGNWSVASEAQVLGTSAYPTWEATIQMPANTSIEWKCVKALESSLEIIEWQGGGNNSVTTGASGSAATQGSF